MITFDEYLDKEVGEFSEKLEINHTQELLMQYKEVVLTNIIKEFGLSQFFNMYKRGGNVTTLHNAQNGIYANSEDERRFEQSYSQDLRKHLYEEGFKQDRKTAFQQNDTMFDDYTGRMLNKDGRTHRDHVISANEIQNNDAARLYMSDTERGNMAVDNKNLAWTDGSLNQSKSDHDLIQWMNKDNPKDPNQTNQERFGIDAELAKQKYNEARNHVDTSIQEAKKSYYFTHVTTTGVKQGFQMGKKQAIGLFLYEFQEAVMEEMKAYFAKYSSFGTWSEKIEEFKNACLNIKSRLLSKAKKIFVAFTDGFISGFVGNLITVFINSFISTSKNVVRVLNEGIHALIKAIKILISPPEGMTKKEALFEASKVIAASVITTIGAILTESFVTYLKTTIFAPFAHVIGGVLGGILTGIVSVTVVYSLDHFGEIVEKLKNMFRDLTYDLRISAAEMRANYENAICEIDAHYQEVLKKIYDEYERLHVLTSNAYNTTLDSAELFKHSVTLAEALEVDESKVIRSRQNVLDFFNN